MTDSTTPRPSPPGGSHPPALVLDEYAVAGPSAERLAEWVLAFPEHEAALRELTEAWESDNQPRPSSRGPAATAALRERGRVLTAARLRADLPALGLSDAELSLDSVAALSLDSVAAPPEPAPEGSPAAVDALLQRAARSVAEVRTALGLPRALWAKLRAGMLSLDSDESRQAFERLVDGLAYVLAFPRADVFAAVPLIATLPQGHSRADDRPEPSQVDLAGALRDDPALDDDVRRFYLDGEGSPPYRGAL